MLTHECYTTPMKKLTRPKALFFIAAFVSFLLANYLWFTGHREQGIFVGIWVPSICSAGALLLAKERDE